MSYFNHHYASNSDIKKIVAKHNGVPEMDGLQGIFDFGTAFHAGILEPSKIDFSKLNPEQVNLLSSMTKTFWKDELCRSVVSSPDFRREHEFYRVNRMGLKGVRCKCDGISKKLRIILELKGLSVTTEKAFRDSIEHLGYDQGAAWYLNTTLGAVKYTHKLIVGISKREPDRLFKLLIGWDDPYYKRGMEKVEKGVQTWKFYGLE